MSRLCLPCLRWLLAGAMLLAILQTPGHAADAAPHILAVVPEARPVGEARLTWFGLRIYDAVLYAGNGKYQPGQPFALDLTYARDLVGKQIAERSITEIRKQGLGTEEDHARWMAILTRLIPDVRQGDRLTGTWAAGQGLLFRNGAPLGPIGDARLSQAFFAIWLSERTSEPALRASLLGAK